MNDAYEILLYTEDSGVGGVAQYNHSVLCALAGRGFRVSCAQARADTPLVRQQAEIGVRHAWLDFDPLADTPRTLHNEADAEQVYRATKPDLIVFSNGWPVSSLAAKRVATRRGLPYVVIEGMVDAWIAERFAAHLEEVAQHYAQARAVLAVSEQNLQLLHHCFRLPAGKGRVIYSGRPELYFRPPDPETRRRLRAEAGIPDDGVACLTAARLEPIKGYQYLVEALKQLRALPVWSRLYFLWAGGGHSHDQLADALDRLGVADRVKLLGQRWDLPEWFDAADVFLLSSEMEGMPLAVMEAMAKGLPVAASAVGGVPEQLGPTGKLLPPPLPDPRALIAGLVETVAAWAADPGRRRAVGQAGRERAAARFREGRMTAEILAVVERALLPPGDYAAPGLAVVRPDAGFPHLTRANPVANPWPYLRRKVPHAWYVDRRAPHIGLLNRDEALLVHNNALQLRGRRALEIGCFLGWSTCHLALAGVEVDAVDPVLAEPRAVESVRSSLRAAGVLDAVHVHPGASPQQVERLATAQGRRWSFVFIDGNHEGEAPLHDARVAVRFAEADAMVLLHDVVAPDVARALAYLRDHGWQTGVYHTTQLLGVAWRGNVRPVPHQPDPAVAWELPRHVEEYGPAGGAGPAPAGRASGLLDELLACALAQPRGDAPPGARPPATGGHPADWHHRGQQAWQAGDLDEARAAFARALDDDPASPLAHHYLALICWRRGDLRDALGHYRLAQAVGDATPPDEELRPLLGAARPHTLLSATRLASLYALARRVCLDDLPGDIVAWGTDRGGAAALLAAAVQRHSRRPRLVYAFDARAHVPETAAADGPYAAPAAPRPGAAALAVPLVEHLQLACHALEVGDLVVGVPCGPDDPAPWRRPEVEAVALLHVDADRYEPTLQALEAAYDRVVARGVIQLEGYGSRPACRRAVNDFERRRGLRLPLRAGDGDGAWLRRDEAAAAEAQHGQVFWYLAQAAQWAGDVGLARRACQAVLRLVPGLLPAQAMLEQLSGAPAGAGER
jgi:glycosyltransferase involved in cell wall biosynthesis/predicted O-methyltransferase YrrM/tetratricopeptide (TPR) repeat protein